MDALAKHGECVSGNEGISRLSLAVYFEAGMPCLMKVRLRQERSEVSPEKRASRLSTLFQTLHMRSPFFVCPLSQVVIDLASSNGVSPTLKPVLILRLSYIMAALK